LAERITLINRGQLKHMHEIARDASLPLTASFHIIASAKTSPSQALQVYQIQTPGQKDIDARLNIQCSALYRHQKARKEINI
jgi:hypothetical protein